jgi:prepilin-type processing-associated H-X9-DG protein
MEVISRGFGGIVAWLDGHVSGAPIMRERINKGSDRFFVAEKKRLENGESFDLFDDGRD